MQTLPTAASEISSDLRGGATVSCDHCPLSAIATAAESEVVALPISVES
jgi:hypothetical protein